MATRPEPRGRVSIERRYRATLAEVWELWTTKSGIEEWWGPDGFEVEVTRLELRPGGRLEYRMTAIGAEQIAAMKRAGMPLAQQLSIVIKEVVPEKLLVYAHRADFIPGVEPYDVEHRVELFAVSGEVRMVLSFERMHDMLWTERARAGWENELDTLGHVLSRPK